ncbi:MAG: ATP-binding protein [Cyanobacteria bacterium P01_E01_bin.42]
MLKKIYIDNFLCLVDFELEFDSINLLLGDNGSGKSAVFEALLQITSFVNGRSKLDVLFESRECTRWTNSLIQTFALEVEGNNGIYKYEFAIEHDPEEENCYVKYENLWFNDHPLIKLQEDRMEIHNEDDEKEFNTYPFNLSQSVFTVLGTTEERNKIVWFKNKMERLWVFQIDPIIMTEMSEKEDGVILYDMENFVSWYRHLSQNQGKVIQLTQALKEIFDGFEYFQFTSMGSKKRMLELYFLDEHKNEPISYDFSELSDGQRVLIVLYTLLCATQSEDITICLDEPENFLALPEIQPWLMELYDLCGEGKLQALLISHHPELINMLAPSAGYWFERGSNKPSRVKRVQDREKTGLPISELIARGWLND